MTEPLSPVNETDEPLNAAMDDMRDPEVASALRAEQAGQPPSPVTEITVLTGTWWRHLKRNTTYYVVGIAKLQTALTGELADETPMVVYANAANDKLSVRSVEEFCDGRFEQLK